MHLDMMMLAHAVAHATVVAVIGFFVLFAAGKADGIVKLVGMLLGWWIWIIAVGLIVCAVVCPGKAMGWMHDRMGMHGDAPPPPAMAAPAKPDASPPATPAPKKP
jgi:polyferredoxin